MNRIIPTRLHITHDIRKMNVMLLDVFSVRAQSPRGYIDVLLDFKINYKFPMNRMSVISPFRMHY